MNTLTMQAFADEFIQIKESAVSFPVGHPAAMSPLFGSGKPVAPMSGVARRVASGGAPAPARKPVTDVSRGAMSAGAQVKPQPITPMKGPLDFSGKAPAKPPPLPMRKAASIQQRALQKIAKGFDGFMAGGAGAKLPSISMATRPAAAILPGRHGGKGLGGGFQPAPVGLPAGKKPAPPKGALNPGGGML